MSTQEILEYQVANIGFQLDKVFEGLHESLLDHKIVPAAMSARETLTHLPECYIAALEHAAGKNHEWGSYRTEAKSLEDLLGELRARRAEAVTALLATADAKTIHDYIVGHDAYHIGQMALLRLSTDSAWDPYSLYGA